HTIPADVPYLRPRPALAERWQRRLGGLAGLKVGLAWAGNEKHANDFRRSIALAALAPLLATAGAGFVRLQVRRRAPPPPPPPPPPGPPLAPPPPPFPASAAPR